MLQKTKTKKDALKYVQDFCRLNIKRRDSKELKKIIEEEYDKFIHKIQQPKMKELWDNNEDEN